MLQKAISEMANQNLNLKEEIKELKTEIDSWKNTCKELNKPRKDKDASQ